MNLMLIVIILLSFIYSVCTKNTQEMSNSVISACSDGVSLCIYLSGTMAFWGGIMKVAERCSITERLTYLIQKPLGLLFKGLDDKKASELIAMNVCANLLGIGNAAAPLGIKAMKSLCKTPEDTCRNARHITAFLLLNTASIQLIPMTVSALRLSHGAQNPWDCALPTMLTSLCSLICGLAVISVLYPNRKRSC